MSICISGMPIIMNNMYSLKFRETVLGGYYLVSVYKPTGICLCYLNIFNHCNLNDDAFEYMLLDVIKKYVEKTKSLVLDDLNKKDGSIIKINIEKIIDILWAEGYVYESS